MLNTVYQLVRPRQFEVAFEDISMDSEHILVRPTHLSICNADQRYYQGKRSADILMRKLPMALIHEGIGRVVYDPTGIFAAGDRVVMIPNTPVEHSGVIGENYLRSSKFRGSSMNGLMQEYVETTADRLVRVPDGLNEQVAAFTEMITVCYHAISRFDQTAHPSEGVISDAASASRQDHRGISETRRDNIGVWGDGNMGYFTSLLLKMRFPESRIWVFGVHESKLNDFSFADEICLTSAIPENLQLDHCFECVGGTASGQVINQMIDYIRPEGTICLLGVSEDPVPVNTRMVLEKGLRLLGTSRSGREDFLGVMDLYEKQPQTAEYLEKMVGAVVLVRDIADMVEAFEMDIHKVMGKTIMVWDSAQD